jgi:transcriptional regulator with XRE-family HTH domain
MRVRGQLDRADHLSRDEVSPSSSSWDFHGDYVRILLFAGTELNARSFFVVKLAASGNSYRRATHSLPFYPANESALFSWSHSSTIAPVHGGPETRKLSPNPSQTCRLSQDEMAFLLGAKNGAKVSRYERFTRTPGLETALAYEAIFGIPARELFAGMYQRAERNARQRAQLLQKRIGPMASERIGKLKILGEVAPDDGQAKIAA